MKITMKLHFVLTTLLATQLASAQTQDRLTYPIHKNMVKEQFDSAGRLCYVDQDATKKILRKFLAQPKLTGKVSRWYDHFGLSQSDFKDGVFSVTFLSNEAILASVEKIDDELDLNFEQYGPAEYAAHGIGKQLTIKKCDSEYRLAISTSLVNTVEETLYISEEDYLWYPVYSNNSRGASFDASDVKSSLGLKGSVDVYTKEETLEKFGWMTEEDHEDAEAYKQLQQELQKNFSDFRFIKVGEPDSGLIELYLLGRIRSGHYVGLKTISIET